jgi:hypothetical protein
MLTKCYCQKRKIICVNNQSLVGSVMIDVELGRENHDSIPHNCDRKGFRITWCQTSEPDSTGGERQKRIIIIIIILADKLIDKNKII